jgi:hypothetical protein
MAENDYEKEYMERKKRLRILHTKLKDTKEIQEIYHKIMGSSEGAEPEAAETKDEE